MTKGEMSPGDRARLRDVEIGLPRGVHHYISHNEHLVYYETIEQHMVSTGKMQLVCNAQMEAVLAACVEADELWEITVYPNTPIGFNYVIGPTYAAALAALLELE